MHGHRCAGRVRADAARSDSLPVGGCSSGRGPGAVCGSPQSPTRSHPPPAQPRGRGSCGRQDGPGPSQSRTDGLTKVRLQTRTQHHTDQRPRCARSAPQVRPRGGSRCPWAAEPRDERRPVLVTLGSACFHSHRRKCIGTNAKQTPHPTLLKTLLASLTRPPVGPVHAGGTPMPSCACLLKADPSRLGFASLPVPEPEERPTCPGRRQQRGWPRVLAEASPNPREVH